MPVRTHRIEIPWSRDLFLEDEFRVRLTTMLRPVESLSFLGRRHPHTDGQVNDFEDKETRAERPRGDSEGSDELDTDVGVRGK